MSEIIIYWGVDTSYTTEGLRVEPPVPILNKLFKDRIPSGPIAAEVNYNKCPALHNELINVYGMKSIYDYNFEINPESGRMQWGGPQEIAQSYDEEFFNTHLNVRSLKGNLFSFTETLVFFTETPSLMLSLLPAFMEDNNIVKNTICIPGQFDIGKYFRILEYAWHFRKGCNKIEFSRKEISYYIKFYTKEKIKFQRFMFTPELHTLNETMLQTKFRKKPDILSKFKSDALEYYYNIFDKYNFKNKMLKIIKENLYKEEDLEDNNY